MQLLLAFVLLSFFPVWAANEVEEAKASIRALMEPILQKPQGKVTKTVFKDFTLETCEKYKVNWMNVMLQRESATLVYTFRPGCDIEGTIKPAIFKAFPADLKLKNLQNFSRLESSNTITSTIDSMPILNLAIRSGVLTGIKGKVLFDADYAVKINPLKKTKPIEENVGGEIRISEIYGKKVSIKEKVKVE